MGFITHRAIDMVKRYLFVTSLGVSQPARPINGAKFFSGAQLKQTRAVYKLIYSHDLVKGSLNMS